MAAKTRSRSRSTGAKRTPKRPPTTLRERLERATAGLLYTSESDRPFRFFSLPSEDASDLTPVGFLIRLGVSQQFIDRHQVPTDELVQERSLDDFFPDAERLANYYGVEVTDRKVVSELKRWERLKALLRRSLRGVKVLRVGTVDIRCYVAGFKKGDIAGLITTAIET